MVVNKTVGAWALAAGGGVLTWAFLPSKLRMPAIIVLLLGGLVYMQRNGGVGRVWATITSGGATK